MATAYTSLLGLALPVTGELSGTWGDTVNNSITSLLDTSIAGTTTLSSDADVTLTTTTGASNTSRQAIILWTAGGTVTRNITAPAQSKIYTVINKTSSTQSIVLRGVGPTTGITIAAGDKCVAAWNGTDFVKIGGSGDVVGPASATANGIALFNSTTGKLIKDSAASDGLIYGLTVGRGAGAVATNTAVGASALAANTSGAYNTAIGGNALLANTTGQQNIGIGYGAVDANTTGNHVIGIGQNALGANTTADDNTAVGWNSAPANTTGASNTALGAYSLFSNTTASNNTAVGYQAGYSNTTGGANTFFGYHAGYSSNAPNGSNVFIGYRAGKDITTGVSNVVLGGYMGNQGGLDIRTSSNYIVLSDGDGNPRGYFNGSGSGFFSGATVDYPGSGNTNTGIYLESAGQLSVSRANTVVARFNRNTSDGTLLSFARDGTEQGTISVSGGTVSYNAFAGSHWSQLSDGSKPNILRGTVLESINELIQWPNEPTTERLCKVKVSDTAGSKKVYGVFMDWDNDWTATNDMYVTAVGAFVCRINASVTVQEGDLLESNGDGTARVQADDIIRSSTIGKVTCTEKTHQYDDGSYCVPTVLYCG